MLVFWLEYILTEYIHKFLMNTGCTTASEYVTLRLLQAPTAAWPQFLPRDWSMQVFVVIAHDFVWGGLVRHLHGSQIIISKLRNKDRQASVVYVDGARLCAVGWSGPDKYLIPSMRVCGSWRLMAIISRCPEMRMLTSSSLAALLAAGRACRLPVGTLTVLVELCFHTNRECQHWFLSH